MNPAFGVEDGPDGRRPDPSQAPLGVFAPLHGDALHARCGRRDGLFRQLRRVAAPGPRRPVLLPQALRGLRDDRAPRPAPPLAPWPAAGQDGHPCASDWVLCADAGRDAARRRCLGQRRDPLARRGATQTLAGLTKPLLLVVGAACVLLMAQPDMGTTLVICFAIFSLLLAA